MIFDDALAKIEPLKLIKFYKIRWKRFQFHGQWEDRFQVKQLSGTALEETLIHFMREKILNIRTSGDKFPEQHVWHWSLLEAQTQFCYIRVWHDGQSIDWWTFRFREKSLFIGNDELLDGWEFLKDYGERLDSDVIDRIEIIIGKSSPWIPVKSLLNSRLFSFFVSSTTVTALRKPITAWTSWWRRTWKPIDNNLLDRIFLRLQKCLKGLN